MNTEQTLRERAEAIFTFDDYAHNPECNYYHIISKMLDFLKRELQRIGEVYQVVRDPKAGENYSEFQPADLYEGVENGEVKSKTIWLKKLSLLEVKDLEASDNKSSNSSGDAPFKSSNSIGQWRNPYDLGGTGHGDISYSDADPGL